MKKFKLVDINRVLAVAIASLGAIATLNSPAKAQENSDCYMINASGEFVDLSSICNRAPQRPSQDQNRSGGASGGTTTSPSRYYTESTTVVPRDVPVPTDVNPKSYSRYSEFSSTIFQFYYPYHGYHGFYPHYPRYRRSYRPYRRYRRVRPHTYRQQYRRARPRTYRRRYRR